MKLAFTETDPLFWLILFMSLFSLILFFQKSEYSKKLIILIIFRTISILILLFLLFDPRITSISSDDNELIWNIYIDRSLSMSYHSKPSVGSLVSGIDELITRLDKKSIPLNIFDFGSKIDTNWHNGEKNFEDISTNLGLVIDHINQRNNDGLAGSIIITDGQANQGLDVPISDLGNIRPIHIIGVGNSNPLVDISISSINAPPVILKGENAEIEVFVSSYGIVNERVNVTLYSEEKLLGSKILTLSGEGSINTIRFMINPEKTGEIEYKVQVNVLKDEINILNNKQVLPIQVLKNKYRIAIITGAPNFNTRVIKNMLDNDKYIIHHYYLTKNGYSSPLRKFWDTKYDLILFDNNPVINNAKEWESFLRIFAKKILSQKTSFAIFIGNDIERNALSPYLNLMDLELKDPLIELGSDYNWNLSKNWNLFFPLQNNVLINKIKYDFPPLFIDLEIDSSNSTVLANYSISDVKIPLLLLAEKDPLRYMVFTSPSLHHLYYKIQDNYSQDITRHIFKPIFSWLMRTGNGEDFYFRTGKNSYQQGEKVTISGKPVRKTEIADESYIHIFKQGEKVNSKPMTYDSNTGSYTGTFWASTAGRLDYEIDMTYSDMSLTVSKGSLQVQESQIETNNVFLNTGPLLRLSESTNGSFQNWSDKLSVINKIDRISNKQISYRKIIMHNNWWVFFIILFLLTFEWAYRRKIGMI